MTPRCDICERPAVWNDDECSYCEYHAPIPPTPDERRVIEAAPFWVSGGAGSPVACELPRDVPK